MIINDNICTQIGDILYFESNPIWGMIRQFSTVTDEIDGETSNRYFQKKFRYSYDGGIVFSDWKDLTDIEISNVFEDWLNQNENYLSASFDEQSDLKFQFSYERVGNDNTGELVLNAVKIDGRYLPRDLQFKTINNTIFSDIINNNIDIFNMSMNLVNKMYETGIIPEYIDRKKEDQPSLLEDRDYIDLWKTVAEFYVMIFTYALRFSNIYWKRDLLCEYLQQKGIFICDCRDIIEMQKISQNFYDEVRLRGTVEIFRPKGYQYFIGKRQANIAPLDYDISPMNFVVIDGIKYKESHELPYGWVFIPQDNVTDPPKNARLIAPDMNYHHVLFNINNDNNEDIEYSPLYLTTIEPTERSQIFKEFNGEYLRLICYSNKCDEFIYNKVNIKDFGWNIYNASPMYKGLDDQYGTIVKAYEVIKDFKDLTKYPWFGAPPNIGTEVLQPEYCKPIRQNQSYTTTQLCVGIELIASEIKP